MYWEASPTNNTAMAHTTSKRKRCPNVSRFRVQCPVAEVELELELDFVLHEVLPLGLTLVERFNVFHGSLPGGEAQRIGHVR